VLGVLLLVGLTSGVITGLLSLGGVIVMMFLLMVIPPVLHYPSLSFHQISNMVNVQSVFSTSAASYVYMRNRMYDTSTVVYVGAGAFIGAISGAFFAKDINSGWLTIVFACLTTLAAIGMFLPRRKNSDATQTLRGSSILRNVSLVLIGFTIALFGGMLGITAGFILVPILLYLYRFTVKTALGVSVMIGVLISISSLASRAASGNIPPWSSLILMAGAIPGAYLGGSITRRLSAVLVNRLASIAISLVTIHTWWNIFL